MNKPEKSLAIQVLKDIRDKKQIPATRDVISCIGWLSQYSMIRICTDKPGLELMDRGLSAIEVWEES
jgi:hypothetical protein